LVSFLDDYFRSSDDYCYLLWQAGTSEPAGRCRVMNALDVQQNKLFGPIIKTAIAAGIAGGIVFLTSVSPKAEIPDDNRALPQASA
jgi:hypothetical protein